MGGNPWSTAFWSPYLKLFYLLYGPARVHFCEGMQHKNWCIYIYCIYYIYIKGKICVYAYVCIHVCMHGWRMYVWMYGCMHAYIYIYGFKTLVYRFLWPFCGDYGTFLSSVWSHTWGKLGMCPTKHMWMHARFCYQKAWMALGVFNQHIVVPTVFGQVLEVKVTWSQGTNWLQSVSKLWDNSYYIAAIYFELPSTDGERKPFRIVYICMAHIHTYIYIYIYFPFVRRVSPPKKKVQVFRN